MCVYLRCGDDDDDKRGGASQKRAIYYICASMANTMNIRYSIWHIYIVYARSYDVCIEMISPFKFRRMAQHDMLIIYMLAYLLGQ